MRVLYDRKSCVMCSSELRQVAVVPLRDYRLGMSFEDAVALPGAFQDRQVDMWFVERSRYQHLKKVRGWMCPHKRCNGKGSQHSVFANPAQLRAHVRADHRAVFCEVCFTGKRNFVSELQLYTLDTDRNYSSRLRAHMRKEHPQCKFCRNYFLDDDRLYAHLQENHETCAICERNGRMHEYFVNYQQLEEHYRNEHYVCRDEGCRGVVFGTQIELQAHEHTRHNGNSRNTRNRSLRVNLQELHGERDARRRDVDSPRELRIEQERQAARRQAFLSSNVVFSGALNLEEMPPLPSADSTGSSTQPRPASEARGATSTSVPLPSASNRSAAVPRAPDDGHFHPLEPPHNEEEMKARNTILVQTMRSLLDVAAYEQFRTHSGRFQSGRLSSEEYYDCVVDAFGVRTAIRDILPELVALLPVALLREPLLRTCLERTDTKTSAAGYLGPPGDGASSSSGQAGPERIQDEQFPTLNGAPAPSRSAPALVRSFGAPGPEDFPRLGRVNKAQGNTTGPSGAGQASSSSSSQLSSAPARSRPPAVTRSQQTAASIVREAPRPAALPQIRAAAVRRSTVSSGAQLPASAFPALGVVAGSSATSSSDAREHSETETNGNTEEAPPADVSMRVGAVWGGVAGQAHSNNRENKKRGPGRGRGRIPAPPPRTVLNAGEFPDVRSISQSDNASSTSEDQGAPGGSRQATVIDVAEIAKSRRTALQKSSLPRVGGSGYGFAWERKKAQQKRRQIKSDAQQTAANK